MTDGLRTRDEFRSAVFRRDGGECVACRHAAGEHYIKAQDAHHIVERRLFPDGGYYLDNGASLCGDCHLAAESTEISCDELREWAGIKTVVLPPHLYPDTKYDKWANLILPNGQRMKGELFHDESVQKVLVREEYAGDPCEGYVVRCADWFEYREFPRVVGKYVRKGHVATHGHWMRQAVEVNGLKEGSA